MDCLDKLRHERTRILAEGSFRPENVDVLYSPNRVPFNSTERSYIDKEWRKELKNKPLISDGKLFHVSKQDSILSHLILHTCMSSFKEWIGTKGNNFKELIYYYQNNVIRPLSVGSMIVTSDNKWLIGRRQETYDFEGQYTLLAGYMDPDKDIVNSKPDPFFAIKREIEEETGINKTQDISNVICLGIDQPYLAFRTQLRISYNELISNVPVEKEVRRLEAYPYEKQSITAFILSNYEELTPHTLANILMSYDDSLV